MILALPESLISGNWESVQTVVDVGGGTGAMLAEILRARPEIQSGRFVVECRPI